MAELVRCDMETHRLLRELCRNGTLTREQVYQLYECEARRGKILARFQRKLRIMVQQGGAQWSKRKSVVTMWRTDGR